MASSLRWKAVLEAWRQHRETSEFNDHLANISPLGESDLRSDQREALANAPMSPCGEFNAMVARLRLDTKAEPLPPATRIDLYLNCMECRDRPCCRQWLAGGSDHYGYRQFCPNAPMFERIRSLNDWRHAPHG